MAKDLKMKDYLRFKDGSLKLCFCATLLCSVALYAPIGKSAPASPSAEATTGAPANGGKGRRILVRFKENLSAGKKVNSLPHLGLKPIKTIHSKNNLRSKNTSGAPSATFDLSVFEIVNSNISTQQVIDSLIASGDVLYAEVDQEVSIDQIPNDPNFVIQWGLHNTGITGGVVDADLDMLEAWDVTHGDKSVVIGVVDTGIDYQHLDLVNNMWRNPGESGFNSSGVDRATNGVDDDGNGYVDDVFGIDCSNNDSDPMDDHYHGTHVAGIIGAEGNNNRQVVGVAREVSMMALKFLDKYGRGYTSDAIECLVYASNMKADYGINIRATNNSWGGGGESQAMRDVIQAQSNQDILFLAAAGNNGSDNDAEKYYPASYDSPIIVSVASSDKHDGRASHSNYGAETVDVSAPGLGIISTYIDNGIILLGGTSMATPHVSGVVALLAAHEPSLSPAQMKGRILDSADRIPSMEGVIQSGGRLNANEALRCVPGDIVMYHLPITGSKVLHFNGSVSVRLRLSDCGSPVSGETVIGFLSNGESNIHLAEVAEGEYVGSYTPNKIGPVSLELSVIGRNGLSIIESYNVLNVPEYAINPNYNYAWHDASNGTDIGLGNTDDASVNINIGFGFNFYGTNYNDLWVHSNGMIKFGADMELSGFQFLQSPSNGVPNNFIAPFWEDFNPSSNHGSIYSKLIGNAPNRKFVIQWHQLEHHDKIYGNLDGNVTFQVILHEGSNNILFQYKDLTLGSTDYDHAARGLIGIELGAQDSLIFKNQDKLNSTKIANNKAVLFCHGGNADSACAEDTNTEEELFCWALKVKRSGRFTTICL